MWRNQSNSKHHPRNRSFSLHDRIHQLVTRMRLELELGLGFMFDYWVVYEEIKRVCWLSDQGCYYINKGVSATALNVSDKC